MNVLTTRPLTPEDVLEKVLATVLGPEHIVVQLVVIAFAISAWIGFGRAVEQRGTQAATFVRQSPGARLVALALASLAQLSFLGVSAFLGANLSLFFRERDQSFPWWRWPHQTDGFLWAAALIALGVMAGSWSRDGLHRFWAATVPVSVAVPLTLLAWLRVGEFQLVFVVWAALAIVALSAAVVVLPGEDARIHSFDEAYEASLRPGSELSSPKRTWRW